MRQFASYEEENIHYWTNRASGYSGVNQEELATDQKRVWGYTISRKIAARLEPRRACVFWMWAPARAFSPSCWRAWATR